jgi:hypothetical protein
MGTNQESSSDELAYSLLFHSKFAMLPVGCEGRYGGEGDGEYRDHEDRCRQMR